MSLRICGMLLRRSLADWNEDDAPRMGAALAFYAILSMSPLVILVVAVASIVFSRSSAQTHLLDQVQAIGGMAGRDAVQSLLSSSQKAVSGVVATVVGLITLMFGASGVFGELRSALNKIWEVKPKAKAGVWSLIKERSFSLGMVMGVGLTLLISFLASAGLDSITNLFRGLHPIVGIAVKSLDFFLSFLGIAFLFGVILKYVPEMRIEWQDVRVGALVTAFLFTLGKALLALYLGKTSPGSAYGAAGSLIVVVIWVYYSAQIFFFGAEFTHVYAVWHRKVRGSRLVLQTITINAAKQIKPPAA